jgi:alpha-L-fucosidase 2
MKLIGSGLLTPATGKNANVFYQTEEAGVPIVSTKTSVILPQLKETMLYDIATHPGKTYTFTLQ